MSDASLIRLHSNHSMILIPSTPTPTQTSLIISSQELKACGKCKCVKYCSRDCQVSHWKKHKKACIANAAGSPVVADEANKTVDKGTERRKAANAKDSDGRTPLWHAAKNGDLEAVARWAAAEGVAAVLTSSTSNYP